MPELSHAKEVQQCEVCHNGDLVPALDLGWQPLCDDLVPIGETRSSLEYPVEIVFCRRCVTAHQRYQVSKEALFPSTYHYRSGLTDDVVKGMEELVESCESRFGSLAGRTVVDVGCNDGTLLDIFKQRGAKTVGVEPTDACLEARGKGHLAIQGYMSQPVCSQVIDAVGYPDFVTFTNVFAHIDDLPELLRCVKLLLGARTIVVIENHYLGSILSGNQFDTFYHEHPRSYSYTSFTYVSQTLGIDIVDVEFPSRYAGNIRVFLGSSMESADSRGRSSITEAEATFGAQFHTMKRAMEVWRGEKRAEILREVTAKGPLIAKAFPGRASILVRVLGLGEREVVKVYEKPGSPKIGHFVPGTRIPIGSDEELLNLIGSGFEGPVLNLAWHISGEIRRYLAGHGYRGRVIDVFDGISNR